MGKNMPFGTSKNMPFGTSNLDIGTMRNMGLDLGTMNMRLGRSGSDRDLGSIPPTPMSSFRNEGYHSMHSFGSRGDSDDGERQREVMLEVEIIKATDLMAADINFFSAGTSDPYVHVWIDGNTKTKKTTTVIDKCLNPVWEEVFHFKDYKEGDGLAFGVW